MKTGLCAALIAILLPLGVSPAVAAPDTAPTATPAAAPTTADQGAAARKSACQQELQALLQGLPAKKAELAKLRRKWVLARGRTPTDEELKELEEKLAKGETVAMKDNPYVTRSALSTPGRAREAYFKKLDEVRRDEARIDALQSELEKMK